MLCSLKALCLFVCLEVWFQDPTSRGNSQNQSWTPPRFLKLYVLCHVCIHFRPFQCRVLLVDLRIFAQVGNQRTRKSWTTSRKLKMLVGRCSSEGLVRVFFFRYDAPSVF